MSDAFAIGSSAVTKPVPTPVRAPMPPGKASSPAKPASTHSTPVKSPEMKKLKMVEKPAPVPSREEVAVPGTATSTPNKNLMNELDAAAEELTEKSVSCLHVCQPCQPCQPLGLCHLLRLKLPVHPPLLGCQVPRMQLGAVVMVKFTWYFWCCCMLYQKKSLSTHDFAAPYLNCFSM